MKYLFYTNSQSAWNGLLSAMKYAEKSIYIEMYIFVDDVENFSLIDILLSKARSGVSVKLVLDAFGSSGLSRKSIESLRDAGVEILFFKKWFRRLHRKIVIVDERTGFIGGVNFHESARLWNDLLVRVEGKIVHSLMWSFRKVYRACGGVDEYILNYKKKAPFGGTRIWLLEHLPSIRSPRLKDEYKQVVIQAEKSIVIVTPYFLPPRWFKKMLVEAIKRGIVVDVLIPKTVDISFINRANKRYMALLCDSGVNFYLGPTMNHSKLLLVDNRVALVGSQNIDALSFDYNAEGGVFFDDPSMVSDLKTIVDKWKSESVLFDEDVHISISDRIFSFFVRGLQPFL